MPDSEKKQSTRVVQAIREDVAVTRLELWDKLKSAVRRPINLAFVLAGIFIYMTAEYAVERMMDSLTGLKSPAQIDALSVDLQSTSQELKGTAQDIRTLLSELEVSAAANEDPDLKAQLQDLQIHLSGLTDLVERSSKQTDKVATISEGLRSDWERVQKATGGRINGVPDLVLSVGEAVEVCNSLSPVGFMGVSSSGDHVRINTGNKSPWLGVGDRLNLGEGANLDFIGLSGSVAKFRIFCPNDTR